MCAGFMRRLGIGWMRLLVLGSGLSRFGFLLRWHPRFAFGFSCVAPVRGGTYFSLQPQRKVGKRKRLQPPVPARINHWQTVFESSSHIRNTSDQGRSRAAQEALCGVDWVSWITWAYPFVLRACYRVSRMWC